jgi:hypothetical protein
MKQRYGETNIKLLSGIERKERILIMSMRDYAVNDYGVVFTEEMMVEAAKKKGIEYDADDPDYYEVADKLGLEYNSEFTGEATRVYSTGEFDYKTSIVFDDDVLYYLPLLKASNLFTPAYSCIGDAVAEVKERVGEFLPHDFNYEENIRNIVGTYYG